MKFSLPRIYPITDTKITGLSHLEQVKKLIEGGATFIQLREKYLSPAEFYEQANEVMNYTRGSKIKIIINDRVDIALAVKADGVHVGQEDLPPAAVHKILGEDAIIGFSTHNIEQAVEAAKLPLDYIAVGPVFQTQTKENPDPVIGLTGLKSVRDTIGDFLVVAIGGIIFENASDVFQSGANSIALINAILNPPDKITENTLRFVKHL